jgi:histidinol phosphatase-like PHP family hydrolase
LPFLPNSDLHTHTTFSSDGRRTPEAMTERAWLLGLETIAFTEHAEWYGGQRGFLDLAGYRAAVEPCSRATQRGAYGY